MSMPPGVPEDPHAPPTAPMYPVQPQYQPPQPPQPPQAPPAPPQYSAPQHSAPQYSAPQYSAPQYSAPQYEPPTAPVPPQYPGGAPEYPAAPSSGYTTPPPSGAPVYPGAMGDPLVLPAGSSFSAWFAKVQEVAKRSWKSALFVTGLGVGVPYGVSGLVAKLGGYGAGLSPFAIGNFFTSLGALFLGWFLALIVAIAACFVASAGWAGGTWALVQEAAGQPASIGAAFSYGFKRAMALFPWTVVAAFAFSILSCCLFIPGLYVAFAFSMFGFVGVFERGQNPIARSFSLTHNSATFGPTAARIGVLLAVGTAFYWLVRVIEIVLDLFAAVATAGTFTYDLIVGIMALIGGILSAPLFALLLIGLLPTYAELRARQQPLSTGQLHQELG